jgi:CheY-like chemotaxis protein
MDGLKLTKAIREMEKATGAAAIPIVALTADALPETAATCLQNGMQDFLTKPIRLDALERILQEWLPEAMALRKPGEETASADAEASFNIATSEG